MRSSHGTVTDERTISTTPEGVTATTVTDPERAAMPTEPDSPNTTDTLNPERTEPFKVEEIVATTDSEFANPEPRDADDDTPTVTGRLAPPNAARSAEDEGDAAIAAPVRTTPDKTTPPEGDTETAVADEIGRFNSREPDSEADTAVFTPAANWADTAEDSPAETAKAESTSLPFHESADSEAEMDSVPAA